MYRYIFYIESQIYMYIYSCNMLKYKLNALTHPKAMHLYKALKSFYITLTTRGAHEDHGRGGVLLDDGHGDLAPAVPGDDRLEEQQVGVHDAAHGAAAAAAVREGAVPKVITGSSSLVMQI